MRVIVVSTGTSETTPMLGLARGLCGTWIKGECSRDGVGLGALRSSTKVGVDFQKHILLFAWDLQ